MKNKITYGASIFDFDETVGYSNNVVIAFKGKKSFTIKSNEWPMVGEKYKSDGWNFDFTDFNKVTDGIPGPVF